MKKNILTLIFSIIICVAFGQSKQFLFLPKWKVGETKTATVTQKETEYKNGNLVKDTTDYLDVEITVLKENNEDYIIKVLYPNVALRAASSFYEKMGDELSDYKKLELQYKIDKRTGKYELINWKEAQKFIKQSFDQINALIKKKAPDAASYTKLIFGPIEDMFKSKENVESYMDSEVGCLFFPYGKKFITGDTLITKKMSANPFNPKDSIAQTTLSYLSNIDETNKVCAINTKELYDLSAFKDMIKTMMANMAKTLGATDSDKNDASKAIDSIDFDMTNLTITTFDFSSTWPVKIVKTAKVIAATPKGKTEKIVTSTMTLK